MVALSTVVLVPRATEGEREASPLVTDVGEDRPLALARQELSLKRHCRPRRHPAQSDSHHAPAVLAAVGMHDRVLDCRGRPYVLCARG